MITTKRLIFHLDAAIARHVRDWQRLTEHGTIAVDSDVIALYAQDMAALMRARSAFCHARLVEEHSTWDTATVARLLRRGARILRDRDTAVTDHFPRPLVLAVGSLVGDGA